MLVVVIMMVLVFVAVMAVLMVVMTMMLMAVMTRGRGGSFTSQVPPDGLARRMDIFARASFKQSEAMCQCLDNPL